MPSSLVRRLTAPDAPSLRRLRLDALVETPESFGSSYEEEHTLTPEDIRGWITPLDDGAMFGVFADELLAGMVGVGRQHKLKMRHKAHIWSMYVAPAQRGRGMGRLLMHAAIAHARTMRGIRQVQLSVTANNTAASALYASLGFVEYGREREALCVNGELYDETLMALALPDR
ncbi:GNAT family N-acetyltransferase [Achromobacter sp. UMC46]|uniref:GNAT family N-acetyltransferase n=1 Tax=Achromobacter sp. UMC46 TaxID=1862319 RepID=UPI0015FF96D1|nr:GNAT family N-acetyltransferase [Achromobacter sp. UMC46]MBB1594504.1 GNAT family acetyltransferase [Achromobacter sp. UMC46]